MCDIVAEKQLSHDCVRVENISLNKDTSKSQISIIFPQCHAFEYGIQKSIMDNKQNNYYIYSNVLEADIFLFKWFINLTQDISQISTSLLHVIIFKMQTCFRDNKHNNVF
jgi:hypothetical protein